MANGQAGLSVKYGIAHKGRVWNIRLIEASGNKHYGTSLSFGYASLTTNMKSHFH